jgi:type IV pilus biogenesis protein CpaD/CtpE
MKLYSALALLGSPLLLGACADGRYEPKLLDHNLGQSARHMMQAQIADPQKAANPPADSPRKMDGYAGTNTIDSYRESFATGVQESQGITINIGGSGGSNSGSGQ